MTDETTRGALTEVEVCPDCKERIVVVAASEGDEHPARYHVGPLCPPAYARGMAVIAPDDADRALGREPDEIPPASAP